MSGAAVSGDGRAQAGMGVDAGDYNGDGLPDLIVTNFSHDYNTLYENGPAGVFTDRSYATGVAATAGPYLGWGVKFVDLDNDGRLDIFIANGHVYPEVDKHGLGTRYQQRKQVFMNDGARFRHASAEIGGGLLLEKSSRGAAFGDYDNDGDIDVLVINMNERPTLLRNDTTSAQSLDHAPPGRQQEQPGRHRRARPHRRGQAAADDGRSRRRQLHVAQRHAGALRPRRGDARRSDRDPVAERRRRHRDGAGGGSVLCRSRGGGGLRSLRRLRARGIIQRRDRGDRRGVIRVGSRNARA